MNTIINKDLVSDMDKKSGTCSCGNRNVLRYVSEIGRVKDKFITVINVPILYCSECEDGYMTGPDSLRFAERVKKGIENGLTEIEF